MHDLPLEDTMPLATRLREGLWAFGFLALLGALLAPSLIWAQASGREVTVPYQALLILLATWICQWLRKKPLSETIGRPGAGWVRQLLAGALVGAMLMIAPAALLAISGSINWTVQAADGALIFAALMAMLAVAVAEELLFRGFLFQRLIGSIGVWPAQLVVAGLFTLTHLGNPGMEGSTRLIAGINIFAASLLFGWAYLRTGRLAMPIGIHWAANVVQGPLLGLGVSGNSTSAILMPELVSRQAWWTGGPFGLEASIPGLVSLLVVVVLFAATGSKAMSWPKFSKLRGNHA